MSTDELVATVVRLSEEIAEAQDDIADAGRERRAAVLKLNESGLSATKIAAATGLGESWCAVELTRARKEAEGR